MPQIKIYGLRENIEPKRFALSHAIHAALMEAIGTPDNKRFQRFMPLDSDNFIFPSDRTKDYTIIEISMFVGRSPETKKNLIRALYQRIDETTGIRAQDLEITIFETPQCNWGIGGIGGDELDLNYQVDV
ncbi:MAG: tautomerase family protein [Cyanobacteria bacterium J06629_2]